MNATGHAGVSAASLWSVLSTPPVLNSGASTVRAMTCRALGTVGAPSAMSGFNVVGTMTRPVVLVC